MRLLGKSPRCRACKHGILDETVVLLTFRVTRNDGLMRHYARSEKGSRVYDLKPFYRGKKVTVIGAISMSKVLAVMTLDNSIDLL